MNDEKSGNNMDDTNLINQTFDQMDESELALVLDQVSRRIMNMRSERCDSFFWGITLNRIGRWVISSPALTMNEKKLIVCGKRIQAIRLLKERTGTKMSFARDIVDSWIFENEELVDENTYAAGFKCQHKGILHI